MNAHLLTVVVPIFNEEGNIAEFHRRVSQVRARLNGNIRVIYVNDGSRDRSAELLNQIAIENEWVGVIHFSRNFGHQAAITAGLEFAKGEFVVTMDGDLQDPPELIPEMLDKAQTDADVVFARRRQRDGDGWFKRQTAMLFYWIMRRFVDERLPEQVGDFRLMNRKSVDALKGLREQHRFIRGMVAWIGFKQVFVDFDRPPRHSGTTKYPLRRMIRLSWIAVSSFSAFPLYAVMTIGAGLMLLGTGYGVYAVIAALVLKNTVKGWSSLVVLLCVLNGITLISVGLVGSYVGKIYEEVKGRPLFVVADTRNVTVMNVLDQSRPS